MIDLKLTPSGDFAVDAADLATTGRAPEGDEETAACVAQMAYFALRTDRGDFLLHLDIGSDMRKLLGLPNKKATAEAGAGAIRSAIASMSLSNRTEVAAWPEDLNTMAYEVKIHVGTTPKILTLTLRQALNDIR